ncbi:hypothetical protein GCM10009746_15370 [Microbacterium paludicola]
MELAVDGEDSRWTDDYVVDIGATRADRHCVKNYPFGTEGTEMSRYFKLAERAEVPRARIRGKGAETEAASDERARFGAPLSA